MPPFPRPYGSVQSEPLTRPYRRFLQAAAGAILVLGLLTLSEYLFGVDWGIDHLLVRDTKGSVGTAFPGRMPPNTALCFVLNASALLLLTRRAPKRWSETAVASLGVVVAAFGALSLAGYASDVALGYRWWKLTGMAVHTATSFFLLGLGTVASTTRLASDGKPISFGSLSK